jgi:putative Ca2+/H+ antiporter (TMEM165/GDT1 family)
MNTYGHISPPLLPATAVRSDENFSQGDPEEASIKAQGVVGKDTTTAHFAHMTLSLICTLSLILAPMLGALLLGLAAHQRSLEALEAFASATSAGFFAILATELGDKTFFIAAVLSMRQPRISVWSGAVASLSLMTVGASAVGSAAPLLLPPTLTHYAAIGLFTFFGVRMLIDSADANDGVSDELREVEEEHEEGGDGGSGGDAMSVWAAAWAIVLQAFVLTFTAEWGDRSQVATLAMAADTDVYGVSLGATFGHCLCTGLAVIGGRLLSTRISEKVVLIFGGSLFLIFAVAMGLSEVPAVAAFFGA